MEMAHKPDRETAACPESPRSDCASAPPVTTLPVRTSPFGLLTTEVKDPQKKNIQPIFQTLKSHFFMRENINLFPDLTGNHKKLFKLTKLEPWKTTFPSLSQNLPAALPQRSTRGGRSIWAGSNVLRFKGALAALCEVQLLPRPICVGGCAGSPWASGSTPGGASCSQRVGDGPV